MSISRAGDSNADYRRPTIPTLSFSNTPLPIVHEEPAIVPQFPNVARAIPSSHYHEGRLIVSPSQYRSQFSSQGLPVPKDAYERALQAPVSSPPNFADFGYDTHSPKWTVIKYCRPYPCQQLPFTSKRPMVQSLNGVAHQNTRYTPLNLSRVMKIPRHTMRQLMEAINNTIFSAKKSAKTVSPEMWTYLTEVEMGSDDICKRLGCIQFPSEAVNTVLDGSKAGFVDDTDPDFLPHFWERKHWTGYYMYQVYLMCKDRHEENVSGHIRRGLGDGNEDTIALMLQKLHTSSTVWMVGFISQWVWQILI